MVEGRGAREPALPRFVGEPVVEDVFCCVFREWCERVRMQRGARRRSVAVAARQPLALRARRSMAQIINGSFKGMVRLS